MAPAKRNLYSLKFFYVCPESVLVKCSCLYRSGSKRGRFSHRRACPVFYIVVLGGRFDIEGRLAHARPAAVPAADHKANPERRRVVLTRSEENQHGRFVFNYVSHDCPEPVLTNDDRFGSAIQTKNSSLFFHCSHVCPEPVSVK